MGSFRGFHKIVVVVLFFFTNPSWAVDQARHAGTVLSLENVIGLTLENNLELEKQKLANNIARLNIASKAAEFDITVSTSLSSRETDFLTQDGVKADGEMEFRNASVSLRKKNKYGTRLSAMISESSDDLGQMAPVFNADARTALVLEQPLLKNRGTTVQLAEQNIAEKAYDIALADYRQLVMARLREAIRAYVDLYVAQQNLIVSKNNRDLAKKLLEDNKKRVKVGRVSESDIVLAQARYSRREEDVIRAEQRMLRQSNRLKELISNSLEQVSHGRYSATPLNIPEYNATDIEQDLNEALSLRPEYLKALLNIEQSEIQLKKDKRQKLPELDIELGLEKFSSTSMDDQAWSNYDDGAYSKFGKLKFSMPIANRAAKSQYQKSAYRLQQNKIDLKRWKQTIALNLDSAASQVHNDWRRIKTTSEALRLAQQSLENESKKFQAGRSNSFFVLDLQEDVAIVNVRKIQAEADYFKSLIDYEFEKASLLKFLKVE